MLGGEIFPGACGLLSPAFQYQKHKRDRLSLVVFFWLTMPPGQGLKTKTKLGQRFENRKAVKQVPGDLNVRCVTEASRMLSGFLKSRIKVMRAHVMFSVTETSTRV